MLRTGPVPVGDEVSRLPAVATGEGTVYPHVSKIRELKLTLGSVVKGKAKEEEEDEEAELRKLQEEMAM